MPSDSPEHHRPGTESKGSGGGGGWEFSHWGLLQMARWGLNLDCMPLRTKSVFRSVIPGWWCSFGRL